MAASGSEIRRLAADVAARNQALERASRSPGAAGWARFASLTLPLLICAALALTVALAVSAVKSGGFLVLGGWTALGVVGLVGAILINTVWLRSPRLNGFVITPKSAPDLHAFVQETAKELQSPVPGSIIVTDSLAVRLHQVPRLGLLAGTTSVLEIGLPATQTFSASELAAFITMELARFSASRNAYDRRIERMADLWVGVMQPAARPSLPMDFIAGAFAAWLAPRLAAAAQPSRAAWTTTTDRAAAELVGRQETAQALQRHVIATAFLDEYWHRLADEPILTPKPSFEPYREMADFMPRIGEWEQAEQALRLALVNRPADVSAEPSLAQRLRAIGARPAMPDAVQDAGTRLLGTSYDKAIRFFDTAWQRANAKAWARAYAEQKAAGHIGETVATPAYDSAQSSAAMMAEAMPVPAPIAVATELAHVPVAASSDTDFATSDDFADDGAHASEMVAAAPALMTADHLVEATPELSIPSIETAIDMALGAELSEDFERARDRYVDACEWYPDNGRVWLAYAHALLRHGDEAVLDCIEQTLALAPQTEWAIEDGQPWLDIGKALLEADDEGGIICLEQAIAIDDALTDEAMLLADQFEELQAMQGAQHYAPQPASMAS